MKIYDSDLIIETHNSLPCEICGNTVHYEFIIPNRLWNAVMRPDGKETDKEYICYPCWSSKLLEWTTALTTECDSLKAALAEAEADAETTIKSEYAFVVCEKCRTAIPPQMLNFKYEFCPACGRKITRKEGK